MSLEYIDDDGRSNLGVAARIPSLGWTVIVEQPTSEAYATATELRRQLIASISIALLGMIAVGFVFGRSFINPILKLKRGTQGLAAGQLETRVDIRTGDEFGELGDAFNTMADRLVELQENVKRQERQAMFGRIAAGLVHDLVASDPEHRQQRPPDRARRCGSRVARDVPADRRPRADDASSGSSTTSGTSPSRGRSSASRWTSTRRSRRSSSRCARKANARASRSRPTMPPSRSIISGDRFALGRVYRNLITNAIQATAPRAAR